MIIMCVISHAWCTYECKLIFLYYAMEENAILNLFMRVHALMNIYGKFNIYTDRIDPVHLFHLLNGPDWLACWSCFPTAQCPDNKVLFDSTGVILSPGFPDSYSNVEMCSWLINVEKGYNITLFFELFQTEREFDILEIFDGTLQPSRKNDGGGGVCVKSLVQTYRHTHNHTN